MAYTDKVEEELEEFIKIPTVLVTKDDIPYEFKDTGSSSRFRCRRYLSKDQSIPFGLYNLTVTKGIPEVKLMEFSSGMFLNYVNQRSIYL